MFHLLQQVERPMGIMTVRELNANVSQAIARVEETPEGQRHDRQGPQGRCGRKHEHHHDLVTHGTADAAAFVDGFHN